MPNALELPEVVALLSSFLGPKQLVNCTLVCKTWNNSFAPLLYRSCSVVGPKNKNPSLEAINKHAGFVRRLTYTECVDPTIYGPECYVLTSLNICRGKTGSTVYSSEISNIISQLIRKNSNTLREFSLRKDSKLSSQGLWMALAECHQLKHIQVESISILLDVMEAFWRACTKVDTLSLLNSSVVLDPGDSESMLSLPPLPRLQTLRVELNDELSDMIPIIIIEHAPNLKSLSWQPSTPTLFPINKYRQIMSQRICPRLQCITVERYLMENDDIALTLDAMTDAIELNLGSSYFMEESFRSLMSRHADTIRVIILTRYDAPTSAAVQTIMTSCHSLEVIEAWLIRGRDLVRLNRPNQSGGIRSTVATEDIVSGDDWVCLGLKSLSMEFSLCRYKQDVERWDPVGAARFAQRVRLEQEHAFRQLSRLTRLEKLNVKSRGNSPIHSFDLRLESNGGGLDRLASLKKLEYFNFIHTVQDLSDLELNWMLDHWPRLQTMIGTFSKDHKKSDALRAYVNLRLCDRKL